MKDLKGKRVSTGSPGSATEVMAFRVIEAAGLDKDKDMIRERLGVAESVNAIKDRKIDAFFWVGGLPTAAVTDLAATPGIKIKMIDHAEVVPAMNKKYGNLYVEDVIPKSTYPGMTADNHQATVWNMLVAHEKMSDQVAYNIVKTIFEKREDLIAVHKEAAQLQAQEPEGRGIADPVPSGRAEVFHGKGRQVLNGGKLQKPRRCPDGVFCFMRCQHGKKAAGGMLRCPQKHVGWGSRTMSEKQKPAQDDYVISDEALKKAEEYIEEEEGAINRYRGPLATLMTACAVVMSLFHLYAAIEIMPAYILRPVHVAFALTLVFLLFPVAPRFRHRLMWWDVIFAIASIAVVVYMLYCGDEFGDRATLPTLLDQVFGVVADSADPGGGSPKLDVDNAVCRLPVPGLCTVRALPAGAVDAQGL